MNLDATAALRHDARSIMLHWLTAVLVVGLWALGQSIDLFPKGVPRVTARSLHISVGIVLTLVLAYRIRWRFGAGAQRPPSGTGLQDTIAAGSHKALYVLLIATVVLGLANVWVRGDTLFGLVTVPAFDPGNRELRETVEDWHGLAANILLIVAALHSAAAIAHHVFLKDDVLRRMLPRR